MFFVAIFIGRKPIIVSLVLIVGMMEATEKVLKGETGSFLSTNA